MPPPDQINCIVKTGSPPINILTNTNPAHDSVSTIKPTSSKITNLASLFANNSTWYYRQHERIRPQMPTSRFLSHRPPCRYNSTELSNQLYNTFFAWLSYNNERQALHSETAYYKHQWHHIRALRGESTLTIRE